MLILAPTPAADDVAEAVRREAILLISSMEPKMFLSQDDMIARSVTALSDGKELLDQRVKRIKATLAKADIPALLRKSPAAVVKPADMVP